MNKMTNNKNLSQFHQVLKLFVQYLGVAFSSIPMGILYYALINFGFSQNFAAVLSFILGIVLSVITWVFIENSLSGKKIRETVNLRDIIKETKFVPELSYIFHGNAQFNKELKDNVTVNQYINSFNNEELNIKLDEMFARLTNSQAEELKNLTDEFFNALDEKLIKTINLTEQQTEEFEKAKLSSWKFKLKEGLPLASLTGVTFELEKEWKVSKEIKPDSVASFLRKFLRREELNEMKLNQLEENN